MRQLARLLDTSRAAPPLKQSMSAPILRCLAAHHVPLPASCGPAASTRALQSRQLWSTRQSDAAGASASTAAKPPGSRRRRALPVKWEPDDWPSRDEVAAEVAAAHVLLAHYGFTEMVWNHVTAREAPDRDDYLVTPFPMLFEDVTPEAVADTGCDNVTAHVIHGAVYKARKDVNAVVHSHKIAIEAVSVLEDGVALLTQSGGGFFGHIAYHDYEGLSTDSSEQEAIGAAITANPDLHTLIMRNHGACTFGASVGQAWVRMYYLDIVCKVALAALSTGQRLRVPDAATLRHVAAQYAEPRFQHGACEWPTLRAQADRLMAARREEAARLAPFY